MRAVGFSSGALALGDFRKGVEMLAGTRANAIELSALRVEELPALVEGVNELDLSQFRYVSVHAPSRFSADEEPGVVERLAGFVSQGWPIVLHPDTIRDHSCWTAFGELLLIENMDKRKRVGRTVEELEQILCRLPNAGLCFDIAHARQFDSSMTEAYSILRALGPRVRQVHMSEVNTASRHARISAAAAADFREVAFLIPAEVPVILESPVAPGEIEAELRRAVEALAGTRPVAPRMGPTLRAAV